MFLATTALSEFWDKNQEILFLGSWCLRYAQRSEWKRLNYQVLPSPWNDRERFYEAANNLDEYGEQLLSHLTDYLNSAHNVSHSQQYWRIVIGPWLSYYMHIIYDRYVHLTEAFRHHPNLQTILLEPQTFPVTKGWAELMAFVAEDWYNLHLFSQLLQGMGYSFPKQGLQLDPAKDKELGENEPNSAKLRRYLTGGVLRPGWWKTQLYNTGRELSWVVLRKWCRVALCEMYYPLSIIGTLSWHSGLRMLPVRVDDKWSFTIPAPIFDQRRQGLATLPATGEFERLLIQSLPHNFPSIYLEGFQEARAKILKRYSPIPPVLVSATGWYGNEPFKFLAAEASERNSRLVTVQHGGGYGIYRLSPLEIHEAYLADSYMVWGWADSKIGPYRNLPSLRMSSLLDKRTRNSHTNQPETILFIATDHPRYLYRFISSPVGSQWEEYLAWQFRFLATIPDRLRTILRFRPYSHDYGRSIRERISQKFADILWDDGQPIQQRLKQSRLVVIDHSATTFLETLVANIPTILFWDSERWEVRSEAEPYFEELRQVGILWDSPEAAADKVTAVYDNPWTWWGSPKVQQVRQRFVDRFALARKDWVDSWIRASQQEVVLSQAKPIHSFVETR